MLGRTLFYEIYTLIVLVDVTTALINWYAFCEKYDLDAVTTLSEAPEILYMPIEVNLRCINLETQSCSLKLLFVKLI